MEHDYLFTSESVSEVHPDKARNRLTELIRKHFDLTPYGLRVMLDMAQPIYETTASYGRFGREEPEFTWERTDRAKSLAADAGTTRQAAMA